MSKLSEKWKALGHAVAGIEKQFGKGSTDSRARVPAPAGRSTLGAMKAKKTELVFPTALPTTAPSAVNVARWEQRSCGRSRPTSAAGATRTRCSGRCLSGAPTRAQTAPSPCVMKSTEAGLKSAAVRWTYGAALPRCQTIVVRCEPASVPGAQVLGVSRSPVTSYVRDNMPRSCATS